MAINPSEFLQNVDKNLEVLSSDDVKAFYLGRAIERVEDAILIGVPKDQDPMELIELNRGLMQRLSTFQDRLRQRIAFHESQPSELLRMMKRD